MHSCQTTRKKNHSKHGSKVYNLFSLESPKTVLVTTEEPPFLET